jgi:pre-mRNA-processing factor 19
MAIVGGLDGIAGVYSLSENKIIRVMKAGGGVILDAAWAGSRPVVSTSSGTVKVFEDGIAVSSFNSHAGAANAISLHPSGEILASVGVDKSFVFYDLINSRPVTQVYTDCGLLPPTLNDSIYLLLIALTTGAFHPDGQLFAAGGTDGQIKMYHVKTGEFAAEFNCSEPIRAISFSENGFWFAATTKSSTSVTIFDLRKQGEAAQVKVIDIGSRVDSIRWDYTGQFLATAGPSGITVQQYTKASKTWSEPLRNAISATALEWGAQAHTLVCINGDGVVTILGSK